MNQDTQDDLHPFRVWGLTILQWMAILAVVGILLTIVTTSCASV